MLCISIKLEKLIFAYRMWHIRIFTISRYDGYVQCSLLGWRSLLSTTAVCVYLFYLEIIVLLLILVTFLCKLFLRCHLLDQGGIQPEASATLVTAHI